MSLVQATVLERDAPANPLTSTTLICELLLTRRHGPAEQARLAHLLRDEVARLDRAVQQAFGIDPRAV